MVKTKKEIFWAGVTIGVKREKEKQKMSGTRAPEVQKEVDEQAAFAQGYELGTGVGVGAKMKNISNQNMHSGFGSNVNLTILYKDGVWYLELEDATSRRVTYSNENFGAALEGIFR